VKPFRRAAAWAALAAIALGAPAHQAAAAPEVHRLNLVLSSSPTQLGAKDINDFLNDYNRRVLESRGLEGLDRITFSWLHQAELRYFVRPNIAVSAGAGQIIYRSKREFLPRISESIVLTTGVVAVPVHVGAAYYLQPYTQGDFQARAYLGAGFVNVTNGKVLFEQMEFATDSATTLGGSTRFKGRRDAPGYYLEIGGHMFFASRYSVMISGVYRSAVIRHLRLVQDIIDPVTNKPIGERPLSSPDLSLDVGGLGVRGALAIGF
jgi:hypothetical protein